MRVGKSKIIRDAETMALKSINRYKIPQILLDFESEGRQIADSIIGFTVFADGSNEIWGKRKPYPGIDGAIVECLSDRNIMVLRTENTTYYLAYMYILDCIIIEPYFVKLVRFEGYNVYGYDANGDFLVNSGSFSSGGLIGAPRSTKISHCTPNTITVKKLGEDYVEQAFIGHVHDTCRHAMFAIDANTRRPLVMRYDIMNGVRPYLVKFHWCGDKVVELRKRYMLTVDSEGHYSVYRADKPGCELKASSIYYEPEIRCRKRAVN